MSSPKVVVAGRLVIEDDTKKGMGSAKKGITGAFKDIAKSAAGFLARDVVNSLVGVGKESIKLGAKAETLRTSFENMRDPVMDWDLTLENLQEAVQGTVSDVDLLTAANNAMALGLPRNELDDMFAAAQRVGAAMGRTTLEAVQDLTTGMGKQSKMVLDNLGILVDTNAAYETFAATLGKSASELTDAEKKTAFMNAAIDALNEKAAALGDNLSETQIAQEKFAAAMTNIKTVIGEALIPIIADLMENFSNLLTNVLDIIEMLKAGDWDGVVTAIGDAFKGVQQMVGNIIDNVDWNQVFESLGRFLGTIPWLIVRVFLEAVAAAGRALVTTDWGEVFESMIMAFGSFVKGMFEAIFDFLPKPLRDWLTGKKRGGRDRGTVPDLPDMSDGDEWDFGAQGGFHGVLPRDTTIRAHRGERVDIGKGGGAGGISISIHVGNFIGGDEDGARELAAMVSRFLSTEMERRGVQL